MDTISTNSPGGNTPIVDNDINSKDIWQRIWLENISQPVSKPSPLAMVNPVTRTTATVA